MVGILDSHYLTLYPTYMFLKFYWSAKIRLFYQIQAFFFKIWIYRNKLVPLHAKIKP
jgi:hypothetical protein